jgi:hypothetical protein
MDVVQNEGTKDYWTLWSLTGIAGALTPITHIIARFFGVSFVGLKKPGISETSEASPGPQIEIFSTMPSSQRIRSFFVLR